MIGDKITIDGQEWQEISETEYDNPKTSSLNVECGTFGSLPQKYFKKVQQLPLTFENRSMIIHIDKKEIWINDMTADTVTIEGDEIELLIKAVEAYKALQDGEK